MGLCRSAYATRKLSKTAFIEWVDENSRPNPNFLSSVSQIASADTPLYIICRSGVRSAAARQLLAEAGFTALVNIEGGFEGDIGPSGHRASINGWKYSNLPGRKAKPLSVAICTG